MATKVSVIIPFYNCPYVGQALSSVASQTYADIEVIVVDDGSSVHLDLIAAYGGGRMRYVRKSNGGTASAVNQGIRAAAGEYVAWLSSDDMFCPGKIECQLAFMQARGSEISHTVYSVIDEHGKVIAPHCGVKMAGPLDFYRLLTYANPVNGCTMMARKDTLLRAGLFNEALRYTHDYELWLRMACMGVRFDYLTEALTLYRVHSEMGSVKHKAAALTEFDAVKAGYRVHLERRIKELGG